MYDDLQLLMRGATPQATKHMSKLRGGSCFLYLDQQAAHLAPALAVFDQRPRHLRRGGSRERIAPDAQVEDKVLQLREAEVIYQELLEGYALVRCQHCHSEVLLPYLTSRDQLVLHFRAQLHYAYKKL